MCAYAACCPAHRQQGYEEVAIEACKAASEDIGPKASEAFTEPTCKK